jgi:hypothetical protein
VQEAVVAQFGSGVRVYRSFSRLRRGRNRFEYPADVASEATVEDVTDALAVAGQAVESAETILSREVLTPWVE